MLPGRRGEEVITHVYLAPHNIIRQDIPPPGKNAGRVVISYKSNEDGNADKSKGPISGADSKI